jgi:hypothetical protein
MAYSKVRIANRALQVIGAKGSITALPDAANPNAVKVNNIWDEVLDIVLADVKPRFATLRTGLSQSATSPANACRWKYAYPLPADYLCPAVDNADDPWIWPAGIEPYSIETLSAADGSLCIMTDYDSSGGDDVYVLYVRRITDPTKFFAAFQTCVAYRLAAELALSVVESITKHQDMMTLYERSLKKAKAADRRQLYVENEKKDADAWVDAGR